MLAKKLSFFILISLINLISAVPRDVAVQLDADIAAWSKEDDYRTIQFHMWTQYDTQWGERSIRGYIILDKIILQGINQSVKRQGAATLDDFGGSRRQLLQTTLETKPTFTAEGRVLARGGRSRVTVSGTLHLVAPLRVWLVHQSPGSARVFDYQSNHTLGGESVAQAVLRNAQFLTDQSRVERAILETLAARNSKERAFLATYVARYLEQNLANVQSLV